MNKTQMKADFQDIFFAIYGNAAGDVTVEGDINVCGDVNNASDVSAATATDVSKDENEITDHLIGGTLSGYVDYSTGGKQRLKLQLRYVYIWRCTYDASGVPSVNRLGGTYEWDKNDTNTAANLLAAKRMGYSRAA